MLTAQNFLVGLPGGFRQLSGLRAGEEITAEQRELASLAAFQTPPHNVFPVSRVKGFLPDVVPVRSRPPRRLLRRNSFERLPQVRPVPGLFLKGFFKQIQNRGSSVHHSPPGFRGESCSPPARES